jgi:hypothetical protein
MTNNEARYIEGYAAALQDIMYELTGDNGCAKSYDPMTVEEDRGIMHSYAFDMKDGGRHHAISDYDDLREITKTLLDEVCREIKADILSNAEHDTNDTICMAERHDTRQGVLW